MSWHVTEQTTRFAWVLGAPFLRFVECLLFLLRYIYTALTLSCLHLYPISILRSELVSTQSAFRPLDFELYPAGCDAFAWCIFLFCVGLGSFLTFSLHFVVGRICTLAQHYGEGLVFSAGLIPLASSWVVGRESGEWAWC